jgi:type I restriction enzyme R subunit/putative DNA methylase
MAIDDSGRAGHPLHKDAQTAAEQRPELAREASSARWYSRGYLPHCDDFRKFQFITFRMADSLPSDALRKMESALECCRSSERGKVRVRRLKQWRDNGVGCCALKHPQVAQIMQETLLRSDGTRYRLVAWCIMPNHVHTLIQPTAALAKIVQSWKSFTGRWALAHNLELQLGIPGDRFWMPDYWDRYIRDQQHFSNVVEYIHQNPVTAGLCRRAEDWEWSSARLAGKRAELGLRGPRGLFENS